MRVGLEVDPLPAADGFDSFPLPRTVARRRRALGPRLRLPSQGANTLLMARARGPAVK